MLRIALFITLSCISQITLFAQQEPIYSMFWNNSSVFNPAFTGEQSKFYISGNVRNQWTGFEGSPLTLNGNMEFRLDSLKHSVGYNQTYDRLGLEQTHYTRISYAYHFLMSNNRSIGIGISPTYSIKQYDSDQFVAIDDYTLDPAIPQNSDPIHLFDMNMGVSFLSEKISAGISTTQLLESKESNQFNYANARHSFLYASYKLPISQKLDLIPHILIATDYATAAYNITLIAKYHDRYWLGGSYRKDVFLGAMGGVDIAGKFRVGYSFDYMSDKEFNVEFGGSHEIVLALMIN